MLAKSKTLKLSLSFKSLLVQSQTVLRCQNDANILLVTIDSKNVNSAPLTVVHLFKFDPLMFPLIYRTSFSNSPLMASQSRLGMRCRRQLYLNNLGIS